MTWSLFHNSSTGDPIVVSHCATMQERLFEHIVGHCCDLGSH
jgi:hypothetical protein